MVATTMQRETTMFCYNEKGSPVNTALLMIIIIATPITILQPALDSNHTTNLSTNTTETTITDTENNSFILVPSNQSSTSSLADKTNVTLTGIFDDLSEPGSWNLLLQPALDELNRRHPDMN